MNKFQRQESKELKYLLKVWWIARGASYKSFRRYYRKLNRN